MKYCKMCFTLLFFIVGSITGQTAIDSLQLLLSKGRETGKDSVDILNQISQEYLVMDANESLTYATTSLQLAMASNYDRGIALAKKVLGNSYRTLGQPKLALEHLTASKQKYQQLGDEQGVASCVMNIGMVYADIGDHSKALELYDQAVKTFSKLKLPNNVATTFSKIGVSYIAIKRLDEAQNYLTDALSIHSKNDYLPGIAEANGKLAALMLIKGEAEQAHHYLVKAVPLSKRIGDEDAMVHGLILSGKYFRISGDLKSGEYHTEIALKRAKEKGLKKYQLEAYKELKILKAEEGRLKESLMYSDSYIALRDSMYNTNTSKQIAALEYRNKIAEKNVELAFLNRKKESDILLKRVLGIGISIITLLAFFLIRALRVKTKNQEELLISRETIAKTNLENERSKQLDLKEELHFKNKKLASYALNFVQKNELQEVLYEKIQEVKNANPNNLAKVINDMEAIIKKHRNVDREWEDFKRYFEEVHADFLKNLKGKFPQLSSNDLKIAALTRLHLTIKEASGVLGISPESVKTARYRLRKKLGLSSDVELFSALVQLES